MEMFVIAVVAVVAFALVLIPLMRRRPSDDSTREFDTAPRDAVVQHSTDPAQTVAAAGFDGGSDGIQAPRTENEIELEVQRYRAAVRAGTVCGKCGQANPAESRFCFECGAALSPADSREFE